VNVYLYHFGSPRCQIGFACVPPLSTHFSHEARCVEHRCTKVPKGALGAGAATPSPR
jgi:hypothetical protein